LTLCFLHLWKTERLMSIENYLALPVTVLCDDEHLGHEQAYMLAESRIEELGVYCLDIFPDGDDIIFVLEFPTEDHEGYRERFVKPGDMPLRDVLTYFDEYVAEARREDEKEKAERQREEFPADRRKTAEYYEKYEEE